MKKNNILTYKGYIGEYELDKNVMEFTGTVINSSAHISFHAPDAPGLIQAFQDMIDSYLEFCEELHQEPQKPYNGIITLRIPPELHKDISDHCITHGVSVNKFIQGATISALHEHKEINIHVYPPQQDQGMVWKSDRYVIGNKSESHIIYQ